MKAPQRQLLQPPPCLSSRSRLRMNVDKYAREKIADHTYGGIFFWDQMVTITRLVLTGKCDGYTTINAITTSRIRKQSCQWWSIAATASPPRPPCLTSVVSRSLLRLRLKLRPNLTSRYTRSRTSLRCLQQALEVESTCAWASTRSSHVVVSFLARVIRYVTPGLRVRN